VTDVLLHLHQLMLGLKSIERFLSVVGEV
jgi:hypothetical protein